MSRVNMNDEAILCLDQAGVIAVKNKVKNQDHILYQVYTFKIKAESQKERYQSAGIMIQALIQLQRHNLKSPYGLAEAKVLQGEVEMKQQMFDEAKESFVAARDLVEKHVGYEDFVRNKARFYIEKLEELEAR